MVIAYFGSDKLHYYCWSLASQVGEESGWDTYEHFSDV